MKKLFFNALAMVLTVSSCIAMMSFAEEVEGLGDCNGDKLVDARDASDILEYYAAASTGNETNWNKEEVAVADLNADGIIDSIDASLVLSYYSYVSTNNECDDIYKYIDSVINSFTVVYPENITVSDDGNYLEIEWDSKDEAEGYEIIMNQCFCDNDWNYGNKNILTKDISTADGVSRIEIPLINLVNSNYHEYESWSIPMSDYLSLEMKPYQIRNGEKLYMQSNYEYINPYNITFMQQVKEPHDSFPVYNEQGEKPYFSWTSYVSANDKKILDEFEKEHFTDETNFERIMYMKKWISENLTYASDPDDWNEIVNVSYVDATINHKKGQCIQYNGTLAAYAAYKGYDVKMIQGWVKGTTDWQHFWAVINFENGVEFELNLAL